MAPDGVSVHAARVPFRDPRTYADPPGPDNATDLLARLPLQPLRQKAPWLEPGDEWRSHVPVSCIEVRIVRQHRANCILFGRSVVKRSHGEKHDRRVDVLLPGRRDVPLAGALAPDKHLLTAHGAGRCGHSSGATVATVLGRCTGRLRR